VQLLSSALARLQLQHRGGGAAAGESAGAALGGAEPVAAAGAVDGLAHSAAQSSCCQVLRAHGVRRENVRLNTGSDTFAFNKAQLSFLPAEYTPPRGSYGKGAS
jgi:hypothetical protein